MQQHNCMCTGRTARAPPRTAVPGEGSAAALTMTLTDLSPLRQAVDVLSSSRRRRPGYVHKYLVWDKCVKNYFPESVRGFSAPLLI